MPVAGGEPDPRFNALSGALSAPPFGSPNLSPGTEDLGFLLLVGAVILSALAVVTALVCVKDRKRRRSGPVGLLLLLSVTLGAGGLVAIVIAERAVRIPFGDGTPLQSDVGSGFGLLLALVAAVSAAVSLFR